MPLLVIDGNDDGQLHGRAHGRLEASGSQVGCFWRSDPLLNRTLFRGKRTHAREYPPGLSHREGALRLRRDLGDPVDPRRPAPRHLQQLPSVLHREAEAARYAGAHRSVPEEVRQCAGGTGEEEGGAGEGREEGRAEEGKEGQRAGREGLEKFACSCSLLGDTRSFSFSFANKARVRSRARVPCSVASTRTSTVS